MFSKKKFSDTDDSSACQIQGAIFVAPFFPPWNREESVQFPVWIRSTGSWDSDLRTLKPPFEGLTVWTSQI